MIDFKPATIQEELQNISDLAQEIWREHYSKILSIGQIDYMLSTFQNIIALQDQIKQGYEYFQILDSLHLIGYFAIFQKNDEDYPQNQLFLSKLYIHKDYRTKGIAKLVMAYLKGIAYSRNNSLIWLTVNKQNKNSIQAYQNLGFQIYREDRVEIGEGYVLDDYFMKMQN